VTSCGCQPQPSAHWLAWVSVRTCLSIICEIIGNGKLLDDSLRGDRTTARDSVSIPISTSGWYVLRAYSDRAELPVLDLYPFAIDGAPSSCASVTASRSVDDATFLREVDRAGGGCDAGKYVVD